MGNHGGEQLVRFRNRMNGMCSKELYRGIAEATADAYGQKASSVVKAILA